MKLITLLLVIVSCSSSAGQPMSSSLHCLIPAAQRGEGHALDGETCHVGPWQTCPFGDAHEVAACPEAPVVCCETAPYTTCFYAPTTLADVKQTFGSCAEVAAP